MKKTIAAIVVGGIVIVGAAVATVWQPTLEIIERDLVLVAEQSEDMHRDRGIVYVNGFSGEGIRVEVGPSLVQVTGTHERLGAGRYSLDPGALSMDQAKEEVKETFLYEGPYGRLMTKADGGLYHVDLDGKENKVSSAFSAIEGRTDFIVSEDGSKLLYYVLDSHDMATYHMKTGKKKVVSETLPDHLKTALKPYVSLSPKGGWFYIGRPGQEGAKDTYDVYGADSARLYYKQLEAAYPVWSPTDETIAFFWNGGDLDPAVKNTRVGYILLSKKEIVYFDTVRDQAQAHQQLIWSADGQRVSWLKANNQGLFEEVRSFVRTDNALQVQPLSQDLALKPDQAIKVTGDQWAIWGLEDRLISFGAHGQVDQVTGIVSVQTSSGDTVSYLPSGGGFIYQREGALYWSDFQSEIYLGEYLDSDWVESQAGSPWVVVGNGEANMTLTVQQVGPVE